MCDKGQAQGAEFLARLADNVAAAAQMRSGALVTNVVSGSRQTMTGAIVSKPDIRVKVPDMPMPLESWFSLPAMPSC